MQLTALTALSLVAKLRTRPTPLPDSLSQLLGMVQLKLSHGLTQVGVPPGLRGCAVVASWLCAPLLSVYCTVL